LSWAFSGLFASVLFYLATNLEVWWVSGLYPHTREGLISCFTLAIPFFRNSLLSTWFFLGVFEAVRRYALVSESAAVRS
jgi:hypothetical protein